MIYLKILPGCGQIKAHSPFCRFFLWSTQLRPYPLRLQFGQCHICWGHIWNRCRRQIYSLPALFTARKRWLGYKYNPEGVVSEASAQFAANSSRRLNRWQLKWHTLTHTAALWTCLYQESTFFNRSITNARPGLWPSRNIATQKHLNE